MKCYICRRVKPTKKEKRAQEIRDFWSTVTPYMCTRYTAFSKMRNWLQLTMVALRAPSRLSWQNLTFGIWSHRLFCRHSFVVMFRILIQFSLLFVHIVQIVHLNCFVLYVAVCTKMIHRKVSYRPTLHLPMMSMSYRRDWTLMWRLLQTVFV